MGVHLAAEVLLASVAIFVVNINRMLFLKTSLIANHSREASMSYIDVFHIDVFLEIHKHIGGTKERAFLAIFSKVEFNVFFLN